MMWAQRMPSQSYHNLLSEAKGGSSGSRLSLAARAIASWHFPCEKRLWIACQRRKSDLLHF
jgi:hypothetical protein